MTLYEQFEDIIPDIAAWPEVINDCIGKTDEIATDFLLWYIEERIVPAEETRSIEELYANFKIEKGL